MKVGDLVQEDTEQDIGIVVGAYEGLHSVTVYSFTNNQEELWSSFRTEVISENR